MRHRKKGRKLNRNSSHRRALARNLVASFFEQFGKDREFILTTRAKAKEYSIAAEKYITMAKKGNSALSKAAELAKMSEEEVREAWSSVIAENHERKRQAKAEKTKRPVKKREISLSDSARKFKALDQETREQATKLLTKSLHYRRLAASRLQNEEIAKKLFNEIAPVYQDRKGGYTRVLRTGVRRLGDGTFKAMLAFTPYEKQAVESADD